MQRLASDAVKPAIRTPKFRYQPLPGRRDAALLAHCRRAFYIVASGAIRERAHR